MPPVTSNPRVIVTAFPAISSATDSIIAKNVGGSTGTKSSVAGATSDTLVLAANSARFGATVYNESTAVLYISLGTTAASLTSYTAQVPGGGYYELPNWFTGQVRGIWSAVNGNARVTEMS